MSKHTHVEINANVGSCSALNWIIVIEKSSCPNSGKYIHSACSLINTTLTVITCFFMLQLKFDWLTHTDSVTRKTYNVRNDVVVDALGHSSNDIQRNSHSRKLAMLMRVLSALWHRKKNDRNGEKKASNFVFNAWNVQQTRGKCCRSVYDRGEHCRSNYFYTKLKTSCHI